MLWSGRFRSCLVSFSGSVLVYRFTRTDKKRPNNIQQLKKARKERRYNGYSLSVPVLQDTTGDPCLALHPFQLFLESAVTRKQLSDLLIER